MNALSTERAVDMAGVSIKTYTERLAENTAMLRTHGKLIETVVEVDDRRERCEHFTQEKVEEVLLAGLGRILMRDEP